MEESSKIVVILKEESTEKQKKKQEKFSLRRSRKAQIQRYEEKLATLELGSKTYLEVLKAYTSYKQS